MAGRAKQYTIARRRPGGGVGSRVVYSQVGFSFYDASRKQHASSGVQDGTQKHFTQEFARNFPGVAVVKRAGRHRSLFQISHGFARACICLALITDRVSLYRFCIYTRYEPVRVNLRLIWRSVET